MTLRKEPCAIACDTLMPKDVVLCITFGESFQSLAVFRRNGIPKRQQLIIHYYLQTVT